MNIVKSAILALTAITLSSYAAEQKVITLTTENNIILDQVVSDSSVAKVLQEAQRLDAKLASGDPIYLVLYTPGGSIQAGLEMIDGLKSLNRPVHTITLFAASMGFQTVQGLGKRYITHFGTLMAHKAAGGFRGEFPGQIDSRYAYWLNRLAELDRIAAARTGGKLTPQALRTLYENEYWVDGFGAKAQGLVDDVVTVKCDHSLQGTRTMSVEHMGMSLDLVLSKCPTITGIVDIIVNVHTNQGIMPLRDFLAKGGSLLKTEEENSYYDKPGVAIPKLNVPSLTMDQINAAVNEARNNRALKPINATRSIN